MEKFKYYIFGISPNIIIFRWLVEWADNAIMSEIGLNKNRLLLLTLPDKEYPRGQYRKKSKSLY